MENKKINTSNYESFYLDYLEGNLTSEDKLLFELFLQENPDLREELDMDDFSELVLSAPESEFGDKAKLKVFDSTAKITKENIEDFLIADKEGLLNLMKRSELKEFLLLFPQFNKEKALVNAAVLQPDTSIVFADKASLKQKETKVIWAYWSTAVAAAACLVLVVFLFPDENNQFELNLPVAQVNENPEPAPITIPAESGEPVLMAKNEGKVKTTLPVKKGTSNSKSIDLKVDVLPSKNLGLNDLAKKEEADINLMSRTTKRENISSEKKVDEASYSLAMNNPVKPITKKLSEVIKVPVEIAKGKNEAIKRKGFFVKVGKFEFYSNRKERSKP